jgi:aspartyl-tRNA(Asn)/glutamyl-tRNA(Gln) amidotransferase subunit A
MNTEMTSSERLQCCLDRIKDPDGQGDIIFTRLYEDTARQDAAASDARLAAGRPLSTIDGRIVSIKDLFDVAGEVTTAGSELMRKNPPAERDAAVVTTLRQAGAVIIGKTHMTEFAFSAVGMNPHFGNPGNPDDASRIAGGSSTGAAIAIRKGMCEMSVGSDTGGSIRMPSALCGTVGLKPTQARIARGGMAPLCPSFDTAGAIAANAADCAKLDAVLAGDRARGPAPLALEGLRVGIPDSYFFDGVDPAVQKAFDSTLRTLEQNGVLLVNAGVDDILADMNMVNERATFPNVESSFVFREQMKTDPGALDPFIRSRIERGMGIEAGHYIWMTEQRAALMARMDNALQSLDFMLTPTVPILAATIEDMRDPDQLAATNLLLLRNTWVANFFDLPALSLPSNRGGLAIGMQIIGKRSEDRRVLAGGLAFEPLVRR